MRAESDRDLGARRDGSSTCAGAGRAISTRQQGRLRAPEPTGRIGRVSTAVADAIPSEGPPGSVAWAAGSLSRLRCVVLIADRVESVAEFERYGQPAAVQWAVWLHEVRSRLLPEAGARLVKSTGDGFMAQCGDPVAALRLAQRLHASAASSAGAAGVPAAIRLRVAINLADVIADGVDLYGYDANVAARAMALAEPGQTIVTEAVRDHLGAAPFADLEDLGECHLKHLAAPVRLFAAGQDGPRSRPLVEKPTLPTIAVVAPDTHADSAGALSAWVAEALTARLARSGQLCVVSSLSAAEAARHGQGRGRELVGAALQADLIVVVHCHGDGDRSTVLWEMAQLPAGAVLAADALQVRQRSLFSVPSPAIDGIAAAVLSAANARVVQEASLLPPENLDAYTLQTGAIALMHSASAEAFQRGGMLLNALIDRHPRMVGARTWLAKWHVLRVTRGMVQDRAEEARRALELTRVALRANPADAMALAVEGFVHCHMHRDLSQARDRVDAALESCINEPLAWLFSSVLHAFQGRGQDAMHDAAQAMSRSPADPLQHYYLSLSATAALAAGDYGRALRLARHAYRLNRMHASTLRVMTIAQVRLGMREEAASSMQALLKLQPTLSARAYLEGFPGGANEVGRAWSEALREAGLPD